MVLSAWKYFSECRSNVRAVTTRLGVDLQNAQDLYQRLMFCLTHNIATYRSDRGQCYKGVYYRLFPWHEQKFVQSCGTWPWGVLVNKGCNGMWSVMV